MSYAEVIPTAIDAVKLFVPKSFGDSRGEFNETYNRTRFAEHGIDLDFVQDDWSSSAFAGTIRGLHFQGHRTAQDKLVRVLRGRIIDVAVDLRRYSMNEKGRHEGGLSRERGRAF